MVHDLEPSSFWFGTRLCIVFYTIAFHARVWSINRMLTKVFLVFFIVGLWLFFVFEIVLYNVNILPACYIFLKIPIFRVYTVVIIQPIKFRVYCNILRFMFLGYILINCNSEILLVYLILSIIFNVISSSVTISDDL